MAKLHHSRAKGVDVHRQAGEELANSSGGAPDTAPVLRGVPKTSQQQDAVTLAGVVEAFIAACRRPAVWEDGENAIELKPGLYSLENRSGRVTIEAWEQTRAFSRRLLACIESKPGSLRCLVQRFGRPPGRLTFLDLDRPASHTRLQAGQRQIFAERFRLMLSRQFPGWQIEHLSSALDLQRSFSSVYPRAHLTRGLQSIVALACADEAEETGLWTSALLWFDYLQARAPEGSSRALALFLPEGAGGLTAQRMRWLCGTPRQARLFLFNEHGSAGEVDAEDLGNLDTRVLHPADADAFFRRSSSRAERNLEAHLEMAVRKHLDLVDATLQPDQVHDQVLTFVGSARTIVDLLTIDSDGRLCVIEIKAGEDLQLPMQALDYWMKVRFHLSRGELQKLFTTPLSLRQPPRLVLLAPANAFHSTNATVLRYFSPDIEVQRIGVNSDWNRRLTVVMRLQGSDAPVSHETDCHGNSRFSPYP